MLEFRDGVRLYVPASKIDLVQKYVGGSKTDPELSKLGGTAWGTEEGKRRRRPSSTWPATWSSCRPCARRSPASPSRRHRLAAGVRGRLPLPGNARPAHDHRPRSSATWNRPGRWTGCICGDVGYGKTELAIRAAFKAIDNGRQVAVLVPTTVLAEQHFRTFCAALRRVSVRRRGASAGSASAGEQKRDRQAAGRGRRRRHHRHASPGRRRTCSSRTSAWSSSTRSSASASSTRNGSSSCGRRSTC